MAFLTGNSVPTLNACQSGIQSWIIVGQWRMALLLWGLPTIVLMSAGGGSVFGTVLMLHLRDGLSPQSPDSLSSIYMHVLPEIVVDLQTEVELLWGGK